MRRLTTALLLALAAAGCGAQTTTDAPEFSGTEEDVAQVVEDLQEAAQDNAQGTAATRVCRQLLARELTAELGDRCPQAIEQAFDDTDTTELVVRDVTVSGDSARARITAGTQDEDSEMVELVREDDAWRISRFAGPVQ
jgi:hypothetical protein